MENEVLFSTMASVAVGLAGFSGIVLAVGRQGVALSATERYRFAVLIWNALGATFLAITPMILHTLELPAPLWRIASGGMAVGEATLLSAWVTRSLRQMRDTPNIFNLRTFRILLGMHVANVGIQALAATGIADGPGTYALGILVLLAHATNQFIRMLFLPVRVSDEAERRPS